ncbi:hypothetical protein HYE67_010829 [Fusarium culmorum]|uniref:Uncharacterized protein n=1 Tax=Fusarium culmorum TaxID=5516 RepID=A0A2T4GIN6_FUSCU|nr:hypothetical protein FCULG_00009665 [Fusarium culmorum]QPC68598.1 hypothetical protein HYE67_010829 [Fusarium culmorum]
MLLELISLDFTVPHHAVSDTGPTTWMALATSHQPGIWDPSLEKYLEMMRNSDDPNPRLTETDTTQSTVSIAATRAFIRALYGPYVAACGNSNTGPTQ